MSSTRRPFVAIGIRGSRMTTSVGLISALGGGWDATQLPEARP